MPASPAPTINPIANPVATWAVFLGDEDGNRPGDLDEVDYLEPVKIRTGGGGGRIHRRCHQ